MFSLNNNSVSSRVQVEPLNSLPKMHLPQKKLDQPVLTYQTLLYDDEKTKSIGPKIAFEFTDLTSNVAWKKLHGSNILLPSELSSVSRRFTSLGWPGASRVAFLSFVLRPDECSRESGFRTGVIYILEKICDRSEQLIIEFLGVFAIGFWMCFRFIQSFGLFSDLGASDFRKQMSTDNWQSIREISTILLHIFQCSWTPLWWWG